MFGFLFFKNLLPDIAGLSHDNHDEIAHIHFYNFADSQHQAKDKNENCSSGKFVFPNLLVQIEVYEISVPIFNTAFEMVFNIKSNFLIPHLEPNRKPPRSA